MGLEIAYAIFRQKSEQWVFQACYKIMFAGKKEKGIKLGLRIPEFLSNLAKFYLVLERKDKKRD